MTVKETDSPAPHVSDRHPTGGQWYVAERAMWHCEVRFVRTSEDTSGVVGVTSDGNAKLIAAAPDLLKA